MKAVNIARILELDRKFGLDEHLDEPWSCSKTELEGLEGATAHSLTKRVQGVLQGFEGLSTSRVQLLNLGCCVAVLFFLVPCSCCSTIKPKKHVFFPGVTTSSLNLLYTNL